MWCQLRSPYSVLTESGLYVALRTAFVVYFPVFVMSVIFEFIP